MKLVLSILFLASCCVAKDKPATKPVLNSEQKVAILTAERDYLAAQKAAAPYDFAVQQALNSLQAKQIGLCEDPAKWTLDLMSLECTEVPQPAPPVKPADKK